MTAQPHTEDTTSEDVRRQAIETFVAGVNRELRSVPLAPDLLDAIASQASALRKEFTPAAPALTMADLAAGYWDAIEQWRNAAPTGLGKLESVLGGGFLPGRLTALLGAPGFGKTALACQIAESIACLGRPVVYLTSEDSPHMLFCRTLARLGNLDYGYLLRGQVNQSQIQSAMQAYTQRQSAHRMLVMEQHGAFSIDGITTTANRHFSRYSDAPGGPGLLVVDYLQRLARSIGGGLELRQAVTALTERLRDVAHELGCAVLVLSAQGRDTYKAGGSKDMNTLGTAKESGDIEYTCDCLMALTPGDMGDSTPSSAPIVLRVDKNRQGMTGAIKLAFNKTRQMFMEQE